jgi:CheY-like chemotaxis protein
MATILVVDDDEATRYSTGRLLKSLGHEVYEAADGEEALELCLDGDFDLVVMDILMPVMDGLETIDELKRQRPYLPVIACTGHDGGRLHYLDVAMHIGASGVLKKPFSGSVLADMVGDLLAGAAAKFGGVRPGIA